MPRIFRFFNILAVLISLGMTIHSSTCIAAETPPLSPPDEIRKLVAQPGGLELVTSTPFRPGAVQHIVFFKYVDGITPEQRSAVVSRFMALQKLCERDGHPYILSLQTGAQNSGEGASEGIQDAFIVTFKSQGDRNYYVGAPLIDTSTPENKIKNQKFFDPHHQAFKDFVGPLLNSNGGAVVVDFGVEDAVGSIKLQRVKAPEDPQPSMSGADRLKNQIANFGVRKVTEAEFDPGPVQHVVAFAFKPEVTVDQKAEVARRFLALQKLCQRNDHPYVVSILEGAQNSTEGADQGFEQIYQVTFKSQGDRNHYVGQPVVTDPKYYDPAHQAFKDFVGPLLRTDNGALVVDFAVAQEALLSPAAQRAALVACIKQNLNPSIQPPVH